MSQELSIRTMTVEAKRGSIYADDGRALANSVPYFEIRIDFMSDAMTDDIFNEYIEGLAINLSLFHGDQSKEAYLSEMTKARQDGNRAYLVSKKANYGELEEIKAWEFFQLGRYKSGMVVTERSERQMPFGILAKRTIGYVGDGGQFKVGIEGAFDEYLKGTEGEILVQRLAGGTYKPINTESAIAAVPGKNVHTNINIAIQDVAERELLETLEKNSADHGCVVVMEVATGKIKAIVNIGRKNDGTYNEIKNYAVWEGAEPGSTFKAASMLALLDQGFINKSDSVDIENGTTWFYDQKMKDSHPPKAGESILSAQQVLERSSNVGIAKLANKYFAPDPVSFYNHMKKFGLTELTGVEVKGEQSPVINTPDNWSGVSIAWMSTGYELKLTPLQTLTFYNAIANDGIPMKPYLVDRISEYDNTVIQFEPEVMGGKIASDLAIQQLQEMLIGVVERGTAKSISNDNYSIAGKTGTAQIANASTNYADKVYQSSFVGYFPADKPIYSCIVVVTAPSNGLYYGSSVAAPVFKEIADKVYATALQMHTDVEEVEADPILFACSGKALAADLYQVMFQIGEDFEPLDEGEYVRWSAEESWMTVEKLEINTEKIPDVRGMGLTDALYLLESEGYEVSVEGYGRVTYQEPAAGTPSQGWDRIKLTLK